MTPPTRMFSVHATSLDRAIDKAIEEFKNDRYSRTPQFTGYTRFELRTVRVTPDDYDPGTVEFVFECYK